MNTVRAKFQCQVVHDFGKSKQAELFAVHDNGGENASFAKHTPGGSLSINIDEGTEAIDFFQPGKFYYLDFTEAPEQ